MAETERLSASARIDLIDRLVQGTATPDDAREFLTEFVACVAENKLVPPETLHCLGRLFAEYLKGSYKTLDAAFMMSRRRPGNPGANEGREMDIAVTILDARVRDPALSHEEAVGIACKRYSCGSTKAGKAWSRKRKEALDILRLARQLFNEDLTADETVRAQKIVSPEGGLAN